MSFPAHSPEPSHDYDCRHDEADHVGRMMEEGEPLARLLPTLDLAALALTQPEPVEWAVENLAPMGEVTLFTGPGDAGKSLFSQQLATAFVDRACMVGHATAGGPALLVTCEDAARELHWRQSRISRDIAALAGRLHLVSLRGELGNELATFDSAGSLKPTPAFDRLLATAKATGARLVVLDNVAHLFAGNENDRGQVTQFVNLLNRMAGETGAAVILLGHPAKQESGQGADYSGSTAWRNAVRSQFKIARPVDSDGKVADWDARELSQGKSNYARRSEPVALRWHEGVFVRPGDLPDNLGEQLAENARNAGDNLLFLACLAERNKQERAVSENPASRTFAPLVFDRMAEAKGIGRARLDAAMDRLFRLESIERGFLWRTDRKDRFGLRERCADPRADPALTGCADVRPLPAPTAPSLTLPLKGETGGASEGPPPAPSETPK